MYLEKLSPFSDPSKLSQHSWGRNMWSAPSHSGCEMPESGIENTVGVLGPKDDAVVEAFGLEPRDGR